MEFKSEKYFNEGKNYKEVVAQFKHLCETTTSQLGRTKDQHKYIKGYSLAYYHHYGIFCEPVTYNLDTQTLVVNHEELNLTPIQIKQHIKLKNNSYVVLEKFCLIFSDKQQHEFLFDEIKPFNVENKKKLSSQLNEIFFIKPFSEQLELDLQEKPNPKRKPKI